MKPAKKGAPSAGAAAGAPAQPNSLSAILSRIEQLYPTFGATGQRIASFIRQHAQEVVHMSVSDVAERVGASEGSVVGLCKAIGATGFQQLKIVLAQEIVRPVQLIHEDLEPSDNAAAVISKIFSSNVQALHETQSTLDVGQLQRAVEVMRNARRIEIYGVGSAASIAEDAHYRMLRIGLDVRAVIDPHIQVISASLCDPTVATLTISHSGSTHETVMATRLAKEAGARTICLTNFGRSPIQAFADIVLFTMARETKFRTEAMTSRLAQLAIIDVLIACLALSDYEKSAETIRRTFDVLSLKRY
ncbi:MurR/RpiR family transcriptional regulator [Paraburkholderia kirstenboschensis]|uniref:MurR/RpiR family transcriptional regulator n=1 Tax=Paraburkholderia kirstenboschensis TaxID=1245436 RepID=A0ABZ0E9I1_9BURK|nr:MurR/RpiR family transcriptional regulator [Paraburkholderia kirstenboschensis]WOD13635.1 MurR/RpiR family transcriptional regulator [Paraburkholderia kirstenboschensis]